MILSKNSISASIFYLIFLLCISTGSVAQHKEISFKHLSTVDGLSNFTVFSIAQDRQGFMWFGTMDGLNRFDGRQIRTYRVNEKNPYSLGNNLVYSLLCSSDSGLWVGTGEGLYYYDFYHDNFHSVPIIDQYGNQFEDLEIKSLMLDETFMWIGTSKGAFKFDLSEEQLIDFADKNIEVITETIESIHKSSDSTIWMGGKQGLFSFKNGQLSRIENDPKSKYNLLSNIISIISDEQGRVWFGTMDLEAGLMIYDPKTKLFEEINTDQGYIPHNKVNCLYRFADGKIWAGTTWGLSIIDAKSYDSKLLLYERRDPGSISQNSIRDIFQAENGVIWIGTYSGGVNYFEERSQLIQHETNIYENEYSLNFNIVSSIYEDKNKNLWIGTEYGGVNIFNRSDRTYKVFKKQNEPTV